MVELSVSYEFNDFIFNDLMFQYFEHRSNNQAVIEVSLHARTFEVEQLGRTAMNAKWTFNEKWSNLDGPDGCLLLETPSGLG